MSVFHRVSARAAVALCIVLTGTVTAEARPEMAGETSASRFAAMDADKDGKLSREEFFKAQPNMKDAAFAAIDADGDGFISIAEWEGFAKGHGSDGAAGDPHKQSGAPAGMGGMGSGMKDGAGTESGKDAGKAPALIMPPSGN